MKNNKINRNYRQYSTYVDGNTVRKYDKNNRTKKQKSYETQKKNREIRKTKAIYNQMDLPYIAMLIMALSLTLYLCYNYLSVQTAILASEKAIEKSEKELELIRNENIALETSINTYTDLDHIYEVATKELGMVYANKDQVINYKRSEREYVRQYEDIPDQQ